MDFGNTRFLLICAILCGIQSVNSTPTKSDDATVNELAAVKFLQDLDKEYSVACTAQTTARWNYITNVTDYSERVSVEAQNQFLEFQGGIQQKVLAKFPNWKAFADDSVRRELKFLAIQGPANMSAEDVAKMNEIQAKMESAYAKATVCEYKHPENCKFFLEPEITKKLKESTDYNELEHYWTSWHDAMGKAVPSAEYAEFIKYQNIMAKANGFNDMSELILEAYNDGTPGWNSGIFKKEMLQTWEQIRPYFNKLHAYVRMELRKNPEYADKIQRCGNIPAHLFGNMWAQQWTNLGSRTKPFPNAPSLDATEAMKEKGYTVQKIFEVADAFFQGMGLEKMTPAFWKNSIFEKPTDRGFVCHASAEDLCSGVGNTDFRIKMCTQVDMDNLVTAHHEMGHIEYFMQYTNLHFIFRNGANPGFHEALGDTLALAVTTPRHLQCVLGLDLKLGLDCDDSSTNSTVSEMEMNFLYFMALEKIAFFPFAISMDSWRWEVYEGKTSPEQYNSRWWELRTANQGIVPASSRDAASFDPAAKYHIVANVEYLRYFLSFILQFQFYESMCITAGQYDPNSPNSKPLYQCDFAGNTDAGNKLASMMKLGFSKPWPEALHILTGGEGLSIRPLINYFTPLFKWLDQTLENAGETDCLTNI